MSKLLSSLLTIYVFLIPWQARWIFAEYSNAFPFYGGLGIYVTDILFVITVGIWIAWMIKQPKEIPWFAKTRHPILFIPFLLFLYVLASKFWAPDPQLSGYSLYRLLQMMTVYVMLVTAPIRMRQIILAVIAGGVLQSVVAIQQFVLQTIHANTYLGVAEQLVYEPGVSVVEVGGQRWVRAYGTVPHPNILAGYLSIALLFTCGWYLDLYRTMDEFFKTKKHTKKDLQAYRIQIIGALSAFIFITVAFLFTFSRSAWLVFAIGWVTLRLFQLRLAKTKRERWFVAMGAGKLLIVGAIILAMLSALIGPLWASRIQDDSRTGVKSTNERAELIDQAQTIIAQHPLRGSGVGSYIHKARQVSDYEHELQYQPVHNTWLLMWAELGVVVAIPFMLFVVFLLWVVKDLVGKQKMNTEQILFSVTIVMMGISFYFEHFWWSLPVGLLLATVALGGFSRVMLNDWRRDASES